MKMMEFHLIDGAVFNYLTEDPQPTRSCKDLSIHEIQAFEHLDTTAIFDHILFPDTKNVMADRDTQELGWQIIHFFWRLFPASCPKSDDASCRWCQGVWPKLADLVNDQGYVDQERWLMQMMEM